MADVYELHELEELVAPIFHRHGVSRAYLFGSYARGEATQESDVDIRIDGGRIKSMFGLGALYDELTRILKKPVDLVTTDALEHEANVRYAQKFRDNIRKDERLIYEEENR